MFREWRKTEKSFFEDFEREIEEMNELVNSMMHSAYKPMVYGFSMQVGPDGVPHVERFGNMPQADKEMNFREQVQGVREPYTSSIIDEKKNELNITAEMPGIRKEDIELRATENELAIKAECGERKYCTSVNTPCKVDPDSTRAKYNNGILEVTLKLKEPAVPKGKTVKIE